MGESCLLTGARGNWSVGIIGYKLKLSTGLFSTSILNLVVNFIFLVNRVNIENQLKQGTQLQNYKQYSVNLEFPVQQTLAI